MSSKSVEAPSQSAERFSAISADKVILKHRNQEGDFVRAALLARFAKSNLFSEKFFEIEQLETHISSSLFGDNSLFSQTFPVYANICFALLLFRILHGQSVSGGGYRGVPAQ